MSRLSTRIAEALLRHAAAMMPRERADWARAMLGEAEHVAPQDRLSFALGCLRTSYRQRLTDAATQHAILRWSVLLGLCTASLVCVVTASRLQPEQGSAMILALGFICLAAALAFAALRFRRLPMIAAAGCGAAVLAVLTLGDAGALVDGAAGSSRFYRAILIEQLAGWLALLGLAYGLVQLEARCRVGRGGASE